jgi:hypothetical protein
VVVVVVVLLRPLVDRLPLDNKDDDIDHVSDDGGDDALFTVAKRADEIVARAYPLDETSIGMVVVVVDFCPLNPRTIL